MNTILISPDGLPVSGRPHPDLQSLIDEATAFRGRYERQGHYFDTNMRRIPLDLLWGLMSVEEVPEPQALDDVIETPDGRRFANVGWSASDLDMTDMSDEEAEAWLEKHAHTIRDAMIDRGFAAIYDLLRVEGVELTDEE